MKVASKLRDLIFEKSRIKCCAAPDEKKVANQ